LETADTDAVVAVGPFAFRVLPLPGRKRFVSGDGPTIGEMTMDGLNRVTLLGNLGQDPELRFTQGGEAVLNIRMAVTESYLDRDKNRKEHTEWHTVVLWGKRAEGLSKILRKGDRICVEGGLSTRSWEDREGQKRTTTEVKARNVVLCGGGGSRREVDEADYEPGGVGRSAGGWST
jgi:single-strand DNA-binding protein